MARITIVFMIVNGRMYSVTTAVGEMWRELLDHIVRASGGGHDVLDYPPPQPLGPLWARDDKAAVFMCGLPWSLSHRDDEIVAVPVPSPEAYGGQPVYWSYLVVPADSKYKSVRDTFGGRLALTTNESQSGYYAALNTLMELGGSEPLYSELICPTITVPENVKAVAEGRADIASIDSYGFDLLARHVPELIDIRRGSAVCESLSCPSIITSPARIVILRPASSGIRLYPPSTSPTTSSSHR
jgi:hypothetical protein